VSLTVRMTPIGVAAGLALVFGVHGPLGAGTAGFAVVLAAVGAVYLGTLIAPGGPRLAPASQEVAVAGATFACAGLGLLVDPAWLVVGLAGHAVWDWAHHAGLGQPVAAWYPPFCAEVDLSAALFLAVLLWTG
jgi:hypothetical protein